MCCEMITGVSSVSIHRHRELQKHFFFLWLYSSSFEQFGRMCKCLNQKENRILKPHSLYIMILLIVQLLRGCSLGSSGAHDSKHSVRSKYHPCLGHPVTRRSLTQKCHIPHVGTIIFRMRSPLLTPTLLHVDSNHVSTRISERR